jgi:hypothetical protein
MQTEALRWATAAGVIFGADRLGSLISLWALRKAQKIVGLISIRVRLQIFVAKAADSHFHPYAVAFRAIDIECPFTTFNLADCVVKRQLPLPICEPANVRYCVIDIIAGVLIDALYLGCVSHGRSSCDLPQDGLTTLPGGFKV